MKTQLKRLVLIWLAMIFALTACNMPGFTQPTPLSPSPNLTLTAIFAQLDTPVSPPSDTPVAMPEATATLTQAPTEAPTLAPTEPPTSTPTTAPPSPTPIPPTATTKPTSTTVSYVGPSARSRSPVVAYYLQREPTIDGVFDEWSLDRYDVSSVVFGGANHGNASDLSASLMLGWDDNNLYIAARVRDDRYVQIAKGAKLYRGDGIEILLDTNVSRDYYLDELDKDDYQLGVSAGLNSPGNDMESYLWYPAAKAGSYQIVKMAATQTDSGYRIEVKVPWSLFGIRPDVGQHYGFAFSVSDNDRSGESVQQSMVSNVATRTLTDPTTWGDLRLAGRP